MFGSSKKKSSSNNNNNFKEPEEEPIPSVDFNQIDKLLNSEIRDDDVELTDADLEDPELLSQLSQIESGDSLQKKQLQQPTTPIVKQQQITTTTTTTTTTKSQPPTRQPVHSKSVKSEDDELKDLMDFDNDGGDDNNNNNEDYIDHNLIQKLEERLVIYKITAVSARKEGNKDLALQYMKGCKVLTEALENLREGLPIETSTLPPPIAMPNVQQQQQSQQQQYQPPISPPPPKLQTTTTTSPPPPSVKLQTQQLQQPILSPKTEILSRETIEAEERNQIWDLIEEDFRRKHLKLTSEAVRLRDVDKIAAIHLLKESKGVHAIIDQILLNREKGLSPPSFHFEEKVSTTEIKFLDIKESELVIKLSHGTDLQKVINTDFTIYGELPYPSPEQPTKFQTSTIPLSEGNTFSYVTKIQIERKKTLQRCLEKKKMSLVFYSSRMFFMKSVVGKCEIKLSDLLTKCEINEKVPILKDGSKKETGSYLNINIKMREPFSGKELKVEKEKVLVLDTPITAVAPTTTTTTTNVSATTTTTTTPSKPLPTPTPTPTPVPIEKLLPTPQPTTTDKTTTATTTTTTTTTTTSSEKPVTQPQPNTTTKKQQEDEEDDDEMVDDLDKIVSNSVFEWMLENINQQIATQGAKVDLLDRKQAIEIKVMVLETQIQSEILSLEGYVEQIKNAMAEDKKAALKYSGKGRKDLALKLMQRIKIMQKELEECTQPQDE